MTLQLLNNFYVWAKTILFSNSVAENTFSSAPPITANDSLKTIGEMKTISGESLLSGSALSSQSAFQYKNRSLCAITSTNDTGSGYTYFNIGSDNSTGEITDYNLKSTISSGYSIAPQVMHTEKQLIFLLIITNTSTENLTIGEIGIVKNLMTSVSNSYLLGRATLDEIISLPAGETKIFQITFDIS